MTDLSIKELRYRHAKLELDAERLRTKWRDATPTTKHAAELGRQVKRLQAQADDYAALIVAAEEMR
jgi:N-acetylglucosamine kinase-like BadF-type ATPase